jgi:multidrug efflux system membrane fusion protein
MTSACGKRGGFPPPRPVAVRTAPAAKLDVPVIIRAFGNTEDEKSVDVAPQVSGTLVKALIQDGATVTNGQPLFLIDPSDYAARVRQVEGLVAADQANLNLARLTRDRNRPLLEKNLISSENFDTLQARLEAVSAQLRADEAALDQAKLNLARCTVLSPLAGLCSKRFVDEGNLVAAGMTRLVNIRSYDPLFVECTVSEQYLETIRQALARGVVPIEVTPRNSTNAYPGVLDFVDNAVSPLTGTVMLRGKVPNQDLKLWAGQFVEIKITAGVLQGAVMVPESAVQFGKQGAFLYVATPDGKADLRMVKPGVRYGDLLQIPAGVEPDENVVVMGQLMLYPGAAIADVAKMAQGGAPGGAPAKQGDK